MRLGEMLMAAGLISERELDAARAHQRATGGRIGSTLIELGLLEADDVARALARQHGVPAALSRHLRERDRGVASHLPAETARELNALPVALSRGAEGPNLVVCFRDPDPDLIGIRAGLDDSRTRPAPFRIEASGLIGGRNLEADFDLAWCRIQEIEGFRSSRARGQQQGREPTRGPRPTSPPSPCHLRPHRRCDARP